MVKQGNAQYSAQWKRGVVLCFLALFLSSLLVYSPFQTVQAAFETGQDNQPAIARVFNQVIDWTVHAWHLVKNWVLEQGTQIARAFFFWSKEPVAQTSASEPKVLGEKTSQPLPPSPLTYRTELSAPVAVKTAPAAPQAPAEAVVPSEPNHPSASAKATADVPPPPAPAETVPTPEPEPDHPPTPSLVKEGEPEPMPAPESTPEILSEPTRQNSPSYIPILARDFVPPTSKVSALATTTASNVFTVSWTGEDTDTTASPLVKDYDIQYQVDSGAWTDWLLETVLLSSVFTTPPAIEKTYGFRSRARDRNNNLGTYPDSADTSIYVNLAVPNNPLVTSHSSGATLLSTAADEDLTSGNTVEVTLSGTGDPFDVLAISLAEMASSTTAAIDAGGNWSKQFTLAEGANNFSLQSQEADGDQSSAVLFLLNLEMVPTHDVVINEIAWMGTAISASDEWLELYNASSTAIDLTGWTLAASDGAPSVILSGTVAAKSYFLLEHTDDMAVFNVTADQIYGGGVANQMGNGGELLTLRNSSAKLIDKVGSSTAAWFAGDNTTKASMERKDPTNDGTIASSWANNDGTLVNGKASDNSTALTATPKSLNSVNTTIPRVVTNLQQQYIYTTTTSVRLYWTTPKTANLATTTPATYDIRYSIGGGCPITESNWAAATQATGEPTPSVTQDAVATSTISGLSQNTSYCFAMKTNNGVETSGLSNIFNGNTYDAGFTTLGFGGDTVSSNTTIATSTKPYLVNRNFTVAGGVTLTINPGVVIKMNTSGSQKGCNVNALSCAITVSGSLVLGSVSDSINAAVITSTKDDTYAGDANGDGASIGGAGDWDKIAANGAASSIVVSHGIINYGGYNGNMIVMTAGTATISNSIIKNSSGYGIAISGDLTSLTLANSTVQDNLEGIGISTLANANIQGSTFTGNHRGIAIGAAADEANLHIGNTSGNNFYANNRVAGATPFAGIHYSDTTGTLTAENNWWGSASGPTTISPDGDATRDAAVADTTAVIDYTPFAASAFTILPSGL